MSVVTALGRPKLDYINSNPTLTYRELPEKQIKKKPGMVSAPLQLPLQPYLPGSPASEGRLRLGEQFISPCL